MRMCVAFMTSKRLKSAREREREKRAASAAGRSKGRDTWKQTHQQRKNTCNRTRRSARQSTPPSGRKAPAQSCPRFRRPCTWESRYSVSAQAVYILKGVHTINAFPRTPAGGRPCEPRGTSPSRPRSCARTGAGVLLSASLALEDRIMTGMICCERSVLRNRYHHQLSHRRWRGSLCTSPSAAPESSVGCQQAQVGRNRGRCRYRQVHA